MKKAMLLLCVLLLTGCKADKTIDKTSNTESIKEEEKTPVENSQEDLQETIQENKQEEIQENKQEEIQGNKKEEIQENKQEEPQKTCTPKKFQNPYKYAYETMEECKKESQSTAFFDITDNIDDRVFTVNCDTIVDDCGTTWYGVSYNIYDPDNATNDDGIVVVHY